LHPAADELAYLKEKPDRRRFVERILTVIETYRQQKKHLLSFLTDAVAAFCHGLSPPPLLALTGHRGQMPMRDKRWDKRPGAVQRGNIHG
jgi:hypothetical protein